jgi:rhodanese-related sulfurtransferase
LGIFAFKNHKKMKKVSVYMRYILIFIAFLFLNACDSNAQNALAPAAFETKIAAPNVQLVDVRTPQEFVNGHLENAKNVNFNDPEFKQKIALLDKSKPIAVYCGVGGRSGKASKILVELGFKDISDLAGGITAWAAANKKVIK